MTIHQMIQTRDALVAAFGIEDASVIALQAHIDAEFLRLTGTEA